ncbi:pyrroline-5-carboxylate reductase [Nitrosophilus kaiyonis]|uniref:pyrroline-5-carboxylate reductase n=1 Tax=Nitrosophilus kaiyonis TaxID=2930200 RepID=UPI0024934EA9|nr:pyrroline-5-carboxylate reductase [Nitrosophilus kaiyonis]
MKKEISIIGTGKMAFALIDGLKNSFDIEVVGRDEEKLENLKIAGFKTTNLKDFNSLNKIVILAVKPYAIEDISKYFKNEVDILISVLAGVTIERLKKYIKAKSYLRAMPNLSAIYQKSMTTLTGDEKVKIESIKIFENIGEVLWATSEKELDIATAIAGSGPAFLALVAESLMDGGVKCGLSRQNSKKLVEGLFDGFSPLLKNRHPALLKDEVMSPAGTTAEGIAALEEKGIRDAFIKAVQKAFEKTQK